MTLELKFNLLLGAPLEGVPNPVIKPGMEGAPHPAPSPKEGKPEIVRIPQEIVLSSNDGSRWTGVYKHPVWGEIPATNVSVSDNHIAFSALSGNDDKGGSPVTFHFAFIRVDSTDNVVGFSGGQAPYFRSFLMAEGIVKRIS